MDEEVDAVEGRAGGVEGGEDAGGLVSGVVGVLARRTVRAVDEQQVGEGAADVDAGDDASSARSVASAGLGGLKPPLGRRGSVGRRCGLPSAEAGCSPPTMLLPACWRGPWSADTGFMPV